MLHSDPNWPRASAWLAGDCYADAATLLTVLGAPLNSSITPGQCDLAPNAFRTALQRFSSYDVAHDADLRSIKVTDLGDLNLANLRPEEALEPITIAMRQPSAKGAVVLLGGDNGITRPGVHGFGGDLAKCGLITFDAHFDLRDLDGGFHNGNPVRALLADGLPGENIVQIGIQSFVNSQAYTQIARDANIAFTTVEQVHAAGIEEVVNLALGSLSEKVDQMYGGCDLEVWDRAYAPATPGSRPGGLLPWQLRKAVYMCGKHPKVKAIDFVEVDPTKDIASVTVLAATACLLSFASGLLAR